jgi:hypothetical protein
MLSKIQKIWMWIFVVMFALPEILWSPVGNFVYIFIKNSDPATLLRTNFLTEAGPNFLYKIIVLIQLVGLCSFLFILIKDGKRAFKKWQYYVLLILDLLLVLLTAFVFYLIAIINISLVV